MPISAYSPNDSRSRLADWIELAAFSSPVRSQTKAQFIRATSILDESVIDDDDEDLGGDGDDERDGEGSRYILDDRSQNLSDRALDELEYRLTTLGDNYPFEIESAGTSWKLKYRPSVNGPSKFAHYTYVSCLLVSAIKYKFLNLHHLKSEYKEIADHFQLLSYLVAPEVIGGEAYWMGWPRPDDSVKLADALQNVVGQMKLGTLRSTAPPWDSAWAKDGTVDIVAWRHFVGRAPGAMVLYGQVASGMNWRDKPLRTYFDPYYTGWFETTPSRQYWQSMFIPYPVHEDCKPTRNQSFEKLAHANAMRDERTFGLIVDRIRLTDLAAQGYARRKYSPAVDTFASTKLAALFRWRRFAESLAL
jgi:hypothetical protein